MILAEREDFKAWKTNEVHKIEYRGKTFYGTKGINGLLHFGDNLTVEEVEVDRYDVDLYGFKKKGGKTWKDKIKQIKNHTLMLGLDIWTAGSCAYGRVFPKSKGTNGEDVWYIFEWYLLNTPMERGYIAYLTHLDGDVKVLGESLMKRGFVLTAVSPSIHTGTYPVYLFVHPGDYYYTKNKNKKVVLDADLLGSSIASDAFARNPWDSTASNPAVRPIQVETASVKEAEQEYAPFRLYLSPR